MFEDFGFETLTAPQAVLYFALGLGFVFGALAQITRFCLRRALVAEAPEDRREAGAIWAVALITALLGTQVVIAQHWVAFDVHRFFVADLPWLAIALGGLMFGAGMVLTRGCLSRLTVLTATGNLRALIVLLIVAIVAHATLKGVLAPLRTGLGSVTLPLGEYVSLAALPGGAWAASAIVALIAGAFVARRLLQGRTRPLSLVLAALLGLLVPLGWVGTGFVLYDDFDPVALESLSFTSPWADTLFWTVASSAISPGFGVGLVGGVLGGAFLAALLRGEFLWQSFKSPAQTGRYVSGAMLMGIGGVLAGGCTIGAGLAGVPTLSVAALLAVLSIALGALLTHHLVDAPKGAARLNRGPGLAAQPDGGSAGSPPKPALQPAE